MRLFFESVIELNQLILNIVFNQSRWIAIAFLFASGSISAQSKGFNVRIEYTACDSMGNLIIEPIDTMKHYTYLMVQNDCGYPLRTLQDSGTFKRIPPCTYIIKIISNLTDTITLDSISFRFQAINKGAFQCNDSLLIAHIQVLHGHKPYYYAMNGYPPFKINGDSILNISIPPFLIDSSDLRIKDSCGNFASVKLYKTDTFEPIRKTVFCNDAQLFSFSKPNYTWNLYDPLDTLGFKWSIDGNTLSNLNSIMTNADQTGKTLRFEAKFQNCRFTDSIRLSNDNSIGITVGIQNGKSVLCNTDTIALTAVANSRLKPKYFWNTVDTTQKLVVTKPGNYAVIAQNDLGCSDTAFIVIRLSKPVLNSMVTPNLCFAESKGQIDLLLTNGIAPYKYLWKDNAFTEDRSNLQNGIYSVIVTDSVGCIVKDTITISSPPPLQLSLSAHAADCIPAHNGTVTASGSGGVPPYRFQWSNGLTVSSVDTLSPADYTLTLIDSNMCKTSFDFKIDNLNPFRSGRIDTICANTSLKIGNSMHSITGRYTDSLISTKGCDSIVTTFLTVNAPIDYTLTPKDPTCNNQDNGSVALTNVLGFPAYTYFLNDKAVTLNQLTMITAGNYVIKVLDRFNCFKEKGFAITNPPKISLNLGKDTTIAYGDTLIINPISNLRPKDIKQITWQTTSLQGACIFCDSTYKYLPKDDHTLKATIESITGCKVTDEINITINHDFKVFVPNVFMPLNGTHPENQSLTVYGGKQVEKINYFRIFNRYGDEVYVAKDFLPNDRSVAWDGRYKGIDAAQDVYVYLAEIIFADGSVRVVKGDVMLVR